MAENRTGNDNPNFGGAGTGATDAGTTRDSSTGGGGAGSSSGGGGGAMTTGGGGGGTGAATATAPASGIAGRAKEYGQTVMDAASTAKDYISDKAGAVGGAVGDKLQGLRDVDYQQYANQAKDYARQNPGQALLVAAAAGFVIGLLVRGGRK
jgi:ElaB/YqjD/DUF883 family membrane-anchored ribosome-binding protein